MMPEGKHAVLKRTSGLTLIELLWTLFIGGWLVVSGLQLTVYLLNSLETARRDRDELRELQLIAETVAADAASALRVTYPWLDGDDGFRLWLWDVRIDYRRNPAAERPGWYRRRREHASGHRESGSWQRLADPDRVIRLEPVSGRIDVIAAGNGRHVVRQRVPSIVP